MSSAFNVPTICISFLFVVFANRRLPYSGLHECWCPLDLIKSFMQVLWVTTIRFLLVVLYFSSLSMMSFPQMASLSDSRLALPGITSDVWTVLVVGLVNTSVLSSSKYAFKCTPVFFALSLPDTVIPLSGPKHGLLDRSQRSSCLISRITFPLFQYSKSPESVSFLFESKFSMVLLVNAS